MTSFVQIVVNVPSVAGIFDYAVPESLAGKVEVGHLVIVTFGIETSCEHRVGKAFSFTRSEITKRLNLREYAGKETPSYPQTAPHVR